jgi:hypothetical protein
MVTVVTEGIFSYCGVKIKIDTDRYLGPEAAAVRARGQPIGHVTTGEYGSQMLSLGGVQHYPNQGACDIGIAVTGTRGARFDVAHHRTCIAPDLVDRGWCVRRPLTARHELNPGGLINAGPFRVTV